MNFKFLTNKKDKFNQLVDFQVNIPPVPRVPLDIPIDTDEPLYRTFRTNILRGEYTEEQFNNLLLEERNRFMRDMWNVGFIRHEIISQDENGFTLRTEFIR